MVAILNRYDVMAESMVVGPIWMKFGRPIQNRMRLVVTKPKSKFRVESQYGDSF